MNSETSNKIVVIGAGNVGETICYTLMLRAQVGEIVLIDLNEKRAKGAALDISHGTAFYSQVRIKQGGYEECADAKIIIVTAGVPRKEGQTRLELAKVNTGVAKSIAQNIMKYAKNPLIIVVSNPVDVNTYLIQKETGLPAERVIGTGTSLDTARFRYLLSRRCKVDIRDIQGYILGEHGDTQVPIWSSVNVAGELIDHFLPTDEKEKEEVMTEIATKARTAGADVISLKGATFDGIAMSTFRIVESILKNQNTVLPVAHVLDESFGNMAGSSISLPCVINDEGIARTLKISMTDEELKDLEHSAQVLRDFIREVTAND
ncbi:MAG TPA: L-lactate dehydrogenase [Candidatus Merdisoma merdipullorum]|nr:L-lactate dehydrogenase [Candidatus Merdisoma merdipullorum]